MATTPTSVYMSVVEDVINNVRADFLSENVDESVLNELESLWELKMLQVGAVSASTLDTSYNAAVKSGTIPATPVQDLNIPYEATEEYEAPTTELLFPHYMPPGPVDQTVYLESDVGADVKTGKPAPYMQEPAPWMTKKLPGVDVNIAYQEGQEDEDAGTGQPPITKDFFTLATGKRKREELASTYFPGNYIPQQDGASDSGSMLRSFSTSRSPHQDDSVRKDLKVVNFLQTMNDPPMTSGVLTRIIDRGIPQLDGVDDNYDDDVAEEDYNDPVDEEPLTSSDPAGKAAKAEIAESDCSEPPLNEDDDDDDLDDIDQGDDEPKTSHLVLAQFEKVTRSKNKWKCILKDGIMNLNHKDILFVKVIICYLFVASLYIVTTFCHKCFLFVTFFFGRAMGNLSFDLNFSLKVFSFGFVLDVVTVICYRNTRSLHPAYNTLT
ncbi:hypothetical protein O6H91_04G120800 [Diphasiastrum complanatum]|uniref:Uncharacterized protein n=1 Tax=Diphasiastrum complanatum TaxID=34168 RepID=A0ACC2E0Z4_DIPCM|nr:hypothetical protein O6H91_04G120800 [Diphasiastrum complanatum]